MAAAEKSLIDHDETDLHHTGNGEEQHVEKEDLKDTKYSWFVCSCTFLAQVFILGVLHAYGVFFVEFVKEFESPKAKAAWVGSLAYGLSMTFGPVTSMLVRRYGYSRVMTAGCTICAFSILISSFATSIIQLFAMFSVLYGIGTCMAIGPTMTIAPLFFDKHLFIATGITVSGSSFGTLIMGPLSQVIIDRWGWRTAFRVYAAMHVITIIMNSRIRQPKNQSLMLKRKSSFLYDLKIWKNRVFLVWTFSITLVMFGFYIPYVHLVSYAIDQGISPDRASILMMVLGATTAFGRLLFGKIVQVGYLNRLHMHQLSMVVTGTGVMLLPLIKSYIGIILYVVVVGLVDGCYVVLLPILTTSLVGIENTVLAWGFLIGTSSVTFTLGPPVAGALYDSTGSYDLAFHAAGVPIVAGAIILFLIPWAQRTSSQPNIMDIVNEYTASDTFRANSVSEPETIPDRGAMISTVDDVIQTIAIPTSSFMTVRSVATSTDEKMFLQDRSTSTPGSTWNRHSANIHRAVSQLSQTSELNHSFTSEIIHPRETDSDQYIPRIPPPSDPGRCYFIHNQDRISIHSNKSGSISTRDSSNRSSFRSSLAPDLIQESTGFINASFSQEYTLPSASQLLNLASTLDPVSGSQSRISGSQSRTESGSYRAETNQSRTEVPSGQQPLATLSRSATEEPTVKSEDEFEQSVSNQVEKLLETLKIPSPEGSLGYTLADNVVDETDKNEILKPINLDYYSNSSDIVQNQPAQNDSIQGLLPITHEAVFQSFKDTEPVANADAIAQKPHRISPEQHPPENSAAQIFVSENQLTVIPSQNPFTKGKSKPGAKLEELFIEPDSVAAKVAQSTSFEVIEVDSSDNVRQTASATGEIDVFKHLFDDEDDIKEDNEEGANG